MVISCNAFATHYRARGGCVSLVTASVDGSWIVLSNDSFMLSLNWVLARLREDRVFEGRNLKENLLFRVSSDFLHNVLSPIAILTPRASRRHARGRHCVFWWIRVCIGTRDLPIARVVRAREGDGQPIPAEEKGEQSFAKRWPVVPLAEDTQHASSLSCLGCLYWLCCRLIFG